MEIRELRVAYEPLRLNHHHDHRTDLSTPGAAIALAESLLKHESVEVFGLLCLTIRMRLLCYHEASRGGLDRCPALPRDIFRPVLLANGAGLILLHNHPSGDPSPSSDDIAITRRLVSAGEVLGVPVVDHVIVGDARHFSFCQAGLLSGGVA